MQPGKNPSEGEALLVAADDDAALVTRGGNSHRSWIACAASALAGSAVILACVSALASGGGVGGSDVHVSFARPEFQAASLGDGGHELRLKEKRAALGDVPLDRDQLRSMLTDAGGHPTIYVADSEDPTTAVGFDRLKAAVVATLDAPALVGRMELVPGVLACDLPVKIELLEEATSAFKDGLATVTGEYVDTKHEYGVAGRAFFNLDRGKKMIVQRAELEAKTPGLGSYLAEIKKHAGHDGTKLGPDTELSDPEKRALGVRVGASMTHLLAWTRAKTSGKKLALVMETTFDLAGMLSSSSDADARGDSSVDDDKNADDDVVEGKDFESVLAAVAAYHPKDADVVFLDKAVDVATLGDPVMKLTKPNVWNKDVHFVPAAGAKAGAGLYLVTEKFLDKVFPLIERRGFHFVDEWLVRQCVTLGTLKCYQTTPALGRAVRAKSAFLIASGGAEKDAVTLLGKREDEEAAEEAAVAEPESVEAPQQRVTSVDDLFAEADATVKEDISSFSDVEVEAAFGVAEAAEAETKSSAGKKAAARGAVKSTGKHHGNVDEEANEKEQGDDEMWDGSPLFAQNSDGVDDLLFDRNVETASLGEPQPDFQLPPW